MAITKRKATIRGIEVEQMQFAANGPWYTVVAGRIRVAEQADPKGVRSNGSGYHVTSVQIIPMGDRWAYQCMVEYPIGSGVVKPGTDFIDMKDPAGIAKAETSAIGRALGNHGILDETEGIASAEEMQRMPPAPSEDAQDTGGGKISIAEMQTIKKLCKEMGYNTPLDLPDWTAERAVESIRKMREAKAAQVVTA